MFRVFDGCAIINLEQIGGQMYKVISKRKRNYDSKELKTRTNNDAYQCGRESHQTINFQQECTSKLYREKLGATVWPLALTQPECVTEGPQSLHSPSVRAPAGRIERTSCTSTSPIPFFCTGFGGHWHAQRNRTSFPFKAWTSQARVVV